MAVVAAAVAIYGAAEQGYQESEAATYNANLARINQQIANQRSQLNVEEIQKQERYQQGEAKEAYAGSGVRIDTGSPLDELASQHIQGSFREQVAFFNGQVNASQDEANANLNEFLSGQYSRAGIVRSAGIFSGYLANRYSPGKVPGGETTDAGSAGAEAGSIGGSSGGTGDTGFTDINGSGITVPSG